MNMQIQLALSTVVIPLALSFIVQKLGVSNKIFIAPGIFIAWLVSYLWIAGIPSVPPKEAIQWTVWLAAAFVLINFVINKSEVALVFIQFLLSLLGIVFVAWPVLSHSADALFYAELIFFVVISGLVAYRLSNTKPVTPALSLAISNGGVAIVAGLGGSLLMGQLAAVLASAIGAFALYEIYKKLTETQLNKSAILLLVLLSLLLLLTARIYAELSLISVVFLALSLLLGMVIKSRYASVFSLIGVISSIAYLLLTSDQSSYY